MMNKNGKRRNTTKTWGRKPNTEDIQELQKNCKAIKEKIKTGFKNESSLADIDKSLNSTIDVSIVLARHLEVKHAIRSLLNTIRILLNRPEPGMLQDDLLD